MKHTPGPWIYESYDACIVTPDGAVIAEIRWGRDGDESDADGHLMAAAPELLLALEDAHGAALHLAEFRGIWDDDKREAARHLATRLSAVIAKAEGRS